MCMQVCECVIQSLMQLHMHKANTVSIHLYVNIHPTSFGDSSVARQRRTAALNKHINDPELGEVPHHCL